MVLYGFRMVLLCFWCPIFGYLMISDGFVLISHGFPMFLDDFNRRPSPDLRLFYDFLWFYIIFQWRCHSRWFESSALSRSSVILWFPVVLYGFPMVFCFRLILIVGPRPSFRYLMFCYDGLVWFSHGFAMFPIDFNCRPSPDLGYLSYDFLWFCMVCQWFCYVFDWF